jgi:hypothetical protein
MLSLHKFAPKVALMFHHSHLVPVLVKVILFAESLKQLMQKHKQLQITLHHSGLMKNV